MATGMHDKDFVTVGIDLPSPRGIGKPRLLFHRQTIHIGPKHDQRTFTVFQQRNDTRATHIPCHSVPELLELICQSGSRLLLHRGQFGILMKIQKQIFEFGLIELVNLLAQ